MRNLVNYGYGAGSTDRFRLNASLELTFLKNNAILRLQGDDLLAQGDVPNRQILANNVVDTESNMLPRYSILTFTFGCTNLTVTVKKHKRKFSC